MNVTGIVNLIIEEWAYRVNDGMPNPQNPSHLKELSIVLSEMGLSHIKEELVQNLITEKGKTPQPVKEEEKSFSNPILNKKVSYKDKEGNQKDGIVGNLLRQPEGTPARDAAEKVLPPEGSPERDALNQELGGEGGKKGEEEPKSGQDKQAAEKEKQQQAQAMFDPKVDPAMAARLDKEKETQAKLAADAEKDKEAEKPKEEPKKKDGFEPIPAQDVKNEIPEADPDTFGAPSDIPDGIGKEELKKFNTDISKVQQIVADAKAKGEKAPDINLCDVTVPGTNLYCDDNLGIPRDQMPQFKGKPVPGSKAEKMPLNKDGEVDTEPVFREMLKEKGITTTQTEVPADKLKATQSELGGDKVVGMLGALEKDPNHPGITGPIYVSRDGFVIDGHHRWAAIAAYNAKYPDKQIPMKCEVVDMDIKDAIPMCNKFAEDIGIAAKKQGETTGTAGEQQPSEPAKREPANDDPESKAQKFKGKKSGEEIQTMEMEGGGFVYGTKHGNTAMVDDILDDVKSKIPKERWKDVVFVGEGGATNDAGELEFNDEMKYAAPKFKEMGASVDTWDGDDMDVHKSDSKLYQKQKEKTGLKDNQILAGNWASMVGQGEGEGLDANDPEHTMKAEDYLDDEGKQFIQDAAKEAGLPPIEDFDNPTGEKPSEENGWKGTGDRGTLYRLAFPDDNGDKPTKINDIQVAFNDARDEHLIEKNKELTAQGKIPITIAGESHVELVDKMSKKSKDTKQPKEKPEDTKDDKEDIKKEKPGQEATSSSGNKIYSVGGGYYSDKPNGPAKYVRTEWVVDLAFSDIITEDVFALFEKTITATLSNGKQIKVQELPPNDVKKATQKAKAAAASYKEPEQKPQAPKGETPPTDKKVAPPTRKEEPAEPGNPKGEYKPDPKLEPKVDNKGNVAGTDIPAQNEENPNPKFVNKVSTKLDDFYKDVLDEEERAQKAVIEKMKAEGKLPADFKEVHPLPFGFKHPALKDNPELQKEFSAAVKDENKPPHWDLCKVSIPGTNKFCDENIGIPRDKMPQLGGKPKPGSEGEAKAKRIADQNVRKKMGLPNDGEIPADKKQEYDDLYAKENTQHVNVEKEFEDYLKSEGINVSDPVEVPASSLKATQSELVGEQIVGMVNSLEQDPNNPFITAPIMVTRDGYVIDGHHRWATIQAYNMKHTPPNGDKEPIKMKVRIVDEDIETHIPRANAFAEKMGIETMSGKGKQKDEPKPATSTKPSTLSRIKEKLKNWNKKEKEYFNMGYHKPGSEARKSISERLRDKASGAWKAVKDGFKHEVEEFKTAGKAVGKLFSKAGGWNDLSHHEKDALKAVGVKIVTTALFGAAMGGLSYGAVGFAKHVAIEFVPHVIAETFLKGAGRAALFADAGGESEMDAQFIKFTEMIADGLENMKISPEQMEEMIDSYNKKKEEDTMKKEISIIDGIILEILNEAKKPGESKEHPGYYHRGQGYYSTKPDGEITHKTKDGVLKPLNAKEKAQKNAGSTPTQTGKSLGAGDFRKTGEKDLEAPIKKVKKQPTDSTQSIAKQKEVTKELYGKGNGNLLQGSKTSQQALDNGYVEGAPWVAPGNAGSNFNENMSNEGVKILERYPDLDEETLARILYERTKNTKLGLQQKDVSIGSADKIGVPSDIENKEIWRNCVVVARSAKSKANRASMGADRATQERKFGKKRTKQVFGGTKDDLARCEATISKAPKVFIYDAETDSVYEIPKDVMLNWVKSSGGGENAADTATLTIDEKGNVLYDGWSDKKTLKDIQGNSTLVDDYTKSEERLNNLLSSGQIDEKTSQKAKILLLKDKQTIKEIEAGLKDISIQQSNYFLTLNSKQTNVLGDAAVQSADTKKHFANFKKTVDAVLSGKAKGGKKTNAIEAGIVAVGKKGKLSNGDYFAIMCNVGAAGMLSGDDRKVIERIANAEKARYKKDKKQLPSGLDTDLALSELRKKSLNIQTETFKNLNKLTGKSSTGKTKKLGDLLAFDDAKGLLHLDKIDSPKNEKDYHQILKRNTQLAMEGIAVPPKTIKECLGVGNTKELEDSFELSFVERYTYDKDGIRVTGKVVYVYAINKAGKKEEIAQKVYRPKQGPTAPTANTVTWSAGMQKCFDSKK